MSRNKGIDGEEVARLYVEEELSAPKIADRLGCSYSAVVRHLYRRGVETRSGSEPHYDRGELLSWIDAFVAEFGVVPTNHEIRGWPGPSLAPYEREFGSFVEAVREAGYTPRGDRE